MRIEPMTRPYKGSNYSPKAFVQVKPYDRAVVHDMQSGNSTEHSADEAWKKHAKLNAQPRTEEQITKDRENLAESIFIGMWAGAGLMALVVFYLWARTL